MYRGFLKAIVLKMLEKEALSGTQIMDRVEANTGYKPSPGSIYPLLKSMRGEGLITAESFKKSKYYSLTREGIDKLHNVIRSRERLLEERANLISEINISSEDKEGKLLRDDKKIAYLLQDWDDLKDIIIKLVSSKDYDQKRDRIKKTVRKTVKELRKIKDA
ncbi:MAG: PadR family transcriptional regulator [Nanobdellota archaeon]